MDSLKTTINLMVYAVLLILIPGACKKSTNGEFTLVTFVSGLDKPIGIVNNGDSNLFIVEQEGTIVIIDTAGTITGTFLDISDRIVTGGERGLLGMTFHPQFHHNGYFYVNYTGTGDSTHISRFSVSMANRDTADIHSEIKLLTIEQPYTNHNGGHLAFGPDGYLYIGLGDGGSGGDPENRAQNLKDLHGKMLRIDVNSGNPYAIPVSNPFATDTSAAGEVWAYGLRNPWRFSFDRENGDLWITDVGQNKFEEVNVQIAASDGGENYGWRCYEGDEVFNAGNCDTTEFFVFPIDTYPHGPECSVTGGYVYRGKETSAFYGRYFFADFCTDKIWALQYTGGTWVKEEFGEFPANNFSTFGEDSAGELYIAGHTSGRIYKLPL